MPALDFVACRLQASREIETAGRDKKRLLSTLQRLAEQAEEQLAHAEENDASLIACRAGCGSCCVVNVSVLIPEGLAIAALLRRLPVAEQELVTARLDWLWRAVRGLTDDERLSLGQSCAFLDVSGHCLVYPVRPLLCRSVTSTSAESCRQARTAHYFDEQSPVLMNLNQQQLYEAVYLGVSDGLERSGIDARGVKLTGLVRHLLQKPAAGAALLSGKRLDWHDLA